MHSITRQKSNALRKISGDSTSTQTNRYQYSGDDNKHSASVTKITLFKHAFLFFTAYRILHILKFYGMMKIKLLLLLLLFQHTAPHDVTGSPWNKSQVIRTTSASILRTSGKTSGCNGLVHANSAYTSTTNQNSACTSHSQRELCMHLTANQHKSYILHNQTNYAHTS